MYEKSLRPAENLTRSLHYQIECLIPNVVSYVTQLLRLLQHHIGGKSISFRKHKLTGIIPNTHSNTDFIKRWRERSIYVKLISTSSLFFPPNQLLLVWLWRIHDSSCATVSSNSSRRSPILKENRYPSQNLSIRFSLLLP
jgi:hypothetical protein